MDHKIDIKEIDNNIKSLKEISKKLFENSATFPSLNRNCRRILANIKMLELNVSDINDY